MLRTLANFPGILFNPSKLDVLYAEDYNAIVNLMKDILENTGYSLQHIADFDLFLASGASVPVYVVPFGKTFIFTGAIAYVIDPGDISNSPTMGFDILPSNYPCSPEFFSIISLSAPDFVFTPSLANATTVSHYMQGGEQLNITTRTAAGSGSSGRGRLLIFGILVDTF